MRYFFSGQCLFHIFQNTHRKMLLTIHSPCVYLTKPLSSFTRFCLQQLKIKTREEVLAYGIANYNNACRGIVQKYAKEWETIIGRTGRWIDFSVSSFPSSKKLAQFSSSL